MELKVTQCQVGQFNLCGNEKTLSFYIGIVHEGKIIEQDGLRAQLHFNGDPDEYDNFRDSFDNLEYIFQKCYEYSNSICSSTDYKAQCLLFAKTYQANFIEIEQTLMQARKQRIEKQIASLQKELTITSILPDLTYEVNKNIEKEIKRYKDWIENNNKKLKDLKEGSDSHNQLVKTNNSHQARVDKLSAFLITEIAL